ncbi:MAG: ELM1/GtrOC1 family putative glycosyltransferase [Gammaproteobacteria bacterium]
MFDNHSHTIVAQKSRILTPFVIAALPPLVAVILPAVAGVECFFVRVCAYCADVVGMRRQARGLADAIAALAGAHSAAAVEVADAVAEDGVFGRILPRVAAHFAAPVLPRPDILVACGGASAAGALRAKKDGAFVVYVQKPPLSARAFDVVVCGMHDYGGGGKLADNVVGIAGSVGGVNAAMLARRKKRALEKFVKMPRPLTAFIIGGDNRAFSLTPALCRRFVDEVLKGGGAVLASSSRRTSAQCRRILADANRDNDGRFYYYDDDGDDEKAKEYYYDILAAADRAVVSGDSVNMTSEAAAAGMPVYILPLAVRNNSAAVKFHAFHSQMVKCGAALIWRGEFADNASWQPAAFDETARAAGVVWQRYLHCRRVLECQNNDGD